MSYKRPTSFSQNMLFWNCPRTWYMKYVQKIPGIEDLVYAHRGSAAHNCLEVYYPEKTKSIEEMKEMFNKEWTKLKLHESKLKDKKDESWLMVLNGIQYDLPATSTELKICYPDVVAYIDLLDTRTGVITDWKTSTRSHHNEKEYMMQVKFYAWLYYRKFNELPSFTTVKYLKYSGTKAELGCAPTMEDIKSAEKWHFETRRRMNFYTEHPEKLPPFNQSYFFCPYKHLWGLDTTPNTDMLNFIIQINGNYIYLKGDITQKLNEHIGNKFSYELKDAFFIKKKNPNSDAMVRFWHSIQHRLPIGFLNQLIKTLKDYADFKKKPFNIEINDSRYFNKTEIKMPDKLLSGKELRDYQQDAVDTFIAKNKISVLELTTGAGKSLIATEIIRRLCVKTLFVVDKKELLIQTKETLEENLGLEIGVIGTGEFNIRDITVATIQTVMKLLDPQSYINSLKLRIKKKAWDVYCEESGIVKPEISEDETDKEKISQYTIANTEFEGLKKTFLYVYKFTDIENKKIQEETEYITKRSEEFKSYLYDIRFAVFDECHKVAAKSYYKLAYHLKGTEYRLGISATAFRDDGNDMMITATTGDVVFSIKGQQLIEEGHLMKPKIRFVRDFMSKEQNKELEAKSKTGLINETDKYAPLYQEVIVNNRFRNDKIKDIIELHKGKKILILVKLVEHGEILENLIPGSEYIYGDTPAKKRTDALDRFKADGLQVLISTISIFAEGVDIPTLDVVINAAANKGDTKSIQVLGRVLRKSDGKEDAYYYDFIDMNRFFSSASYSRRTAFIEEGHNVLIIETIK